MILPELSGTFLYSLVSSRPPHPPCQDRGKRGSPTSPCLPEMAAAPCACASPPAAWRPLPALACCPPATRPSAPLSVFLLLPHHFSKVKKLQGTCMFFTIRTERGELARAVRAVRADSAGSRPTRPRSARPPLGPQVPATCPRRTDVLYQLCFLTPEMINQEI